MGVNFTKHLSYVRGCIWLFWLKKALPRRMVSLAGSALGLASYANVTQEFH